MKELLASKVKCTENFMFAVSNIVLTLFSSCEEAKKKWVLVSRKNILIKHYTV